MEGMTDSQKLFEHELAETSMNKPSLDRRLRTVEENVHGLVIDNSLKVKLGDIDDAMGVTVDYVDGLVDRVSGLEEKLEMLVELVSQLDAHTKCIDIMTAQNRRLEGERDLFKEASADDRNTIFQLNREVRLLAELESDANEYANVGDGSRMTDRQVANRAMEEIKLLKEKESASYNVMMSKIDRVDVEAWRASNLMKEDIKLLNKSVKLAYWVVSGSILVGAVLSNFIHVAGIY